MTTSTLDPLVRVRNLRVSFRLDRENTFDAVKGISFDIPHNSTIALVGESGSGKSVTSLAILGLLPPENSIVHPGSEIVYGGKNLVDIPIRDLRALRGGDISMIFQEPMTSLNPVFTVGFQLEEVLRLHMGMTGRKARARSMDLLKEVGIPDPRRRINFFPSQLSGGQQQRVMIAMAIACEPKLLIADEPTTALDVTIQKQILDLIAELQKKHQMSVLFITHDLAVVGEIADHVVVMRNGEIREKGTAKQIFETPQDAYTKALLKCRPPLAHRPMRLPVIDDFMNGSPRAATSLPDRTRGVEPGDPIVLTVKDLGKSFYSREGLFGQREFKAVKNVSFELRKGKTLGLVGESGSGKTTVGLTLMRLHEATTGEAIFEGRDLLSMSPKDFMPYKRRIQIIFQNPYASLNPRFTVGQILTEPMQIHGIGTSAQDRTDLAFELLNKVGLPEVSFYKYPHECSGGQRQRIAVARCLTMKPDILICDESVSALDVSVQAQVLNLLQDLQDEYGLSYIFISHDLAVVKYISDQVMVMNEGEIVEIANSDEIYRDPDAVHAEAAGVGPAGGRASPLQRMTRGGTSARRNPHVNLAGAVHTASRSRASSHLPVVHSRSKLTALRCLLRYRIERRPRDEPYHCWFRCWQAKAMAPTWAGLGIGTWLIATIPPDHQHRRHEPSRGLIDRGDPNCGVGCKPPGWPSTFPDQTLALTLEPCKRYYLNSQFENPVQPRWTPVIDYVETITGCKATT
jgi:peptide/nickel transport system ATP-binding protein